MKLTNEFDTYFFSHIPSLQLKAKHIRLKNLPESCSEFDVVFTGTSLDDSYEKELWRQAKKNNVPSIAFIDHWSVYSERFKDKNSFFVLPEIITVIDHWSKTKLISLGIAADKLRVIGSAIFELLTMKLNDRSKKLLSVDNFKFCFLGEIVDKYPSLNNEEKLFNQSSLLEELVSHEYLFKKLENIKVKLHPAQDIANENFVRRLNERKIPIIEDFNDCNFFIGLETILLVEMALKGSFCASFFKPKTQSCISCSKVPIIIVESTKQLVEEISLMESLEERRRIYFNEIKSWAEAIFINSGERFKLLIQELKK